MNPRRTSVRTSCTRTRSPTSRPSKPRTTLPSVVGPEMRTHVPLSDAPVTMRVEARADARGEEERGRGLRDLPLHLGRVVFLLGAVAGERLELVVRVGRCMARRAPPSAGAGRRGRESGGSAPWSACSPAPPDRNGLRPAAPGFRARIRREPSSLTTDSERSGNRSGSASAPTGEESVQRDGVGSRRQSLSRLGRQVRRSGPSAWAPPTHGAATACPWPPGISR